MYNFCMSLWPYAFLILPFLNIIARAGLDETTGELGANTVSLLWVGIALALLLSKVAGLCYSLSMILVKEGAPSAASLGQCNGIVQFAMCFSRSFAPLLVSSLFAISVDYNLLGGYLWVAIMVTISFLGTTVSRRIEHNRTNPVG